MERKTITQTLANGMRQRFTIKCYLIEEDSRQIRVFYTKELLAPLEDVIIKEEEKSYILSEDFFTAYETNTLQDYIDLGVTDLQQMFRGNAILKISEIEGLA